MHRSRLSPFVLDCRVEDVDAAARFWSRALGRAEGGATPPGSYQPPKKKEG